MTLCRYLVVWAVVSLMLYGQSATAQEKIHFASLDRDASGHPVILDGYLFKPESSDATGPHPAVVFMHGCGGLLNRSGEILSRESDWAHRLVQQGYIVLAVDSFTTRGQSSECAHGGAVRPQVERPLDAYGALRFLQTQTDVKPDRIALMGWSHGGGTVLFAIGPQGPAREESSTAGDFRAAVAFYPGWCNLGAQGGAGWHTAIPLLVLIGESDVWTRAQPCVDFVQAARTQGTPVAIHVYPEAYHDFDFPDLPVHSRPEFANLRNHVLPITGTNPAARADAIERVTAYLADHLKD
jgi:dienelactone hydrolase